MNAQDLLVSVVIPAFNAGETAAAALDAVAGQTWQSVEIVVVDDGSTDDTAARVEMWLADHPRVDGRCLRREHAGACAARNAGFRASRGNWVQWLDADDAIAPSKVADQVEVARQHPGSVVYGPWRHEYAGPDGEIRLGPERRASAVDDPLTEQLRGVLCPVHAYLTPRRALESVGGWDETLAADQDGDLYMRLALDGARFVHGTGGIASWRQHDGADRISRRGSREAWESRFRVCEKVRLALTERGDLDTYAEVLAQRYDGIAQATVGMYSDLARRCLDTATGVCPRYPILGHPAYRAMRRFFGLRGAESMRWAGRRLRRKRPVPAWYLESDD